MPDNVAAASAAADKRVESPPRVEQLRTRFEDSQRQRQAARDNNATDDDHEPSTDAQLAAARLDDLLKRKAEILERRIDSETAAHGAINEMQMIGVTLAHLNGELSKARCANNNRARKFQLQTMSAIWRSSDAGCAFTRRSAALLSILRRLRRSTNAFAAHESRRVAFAHSPTTSTR